MASVSCPSAFQTVVMSSRTATELRGVIVAAGTAASGFSVYAKDQRTDRILFQQTNDDGIFDFGVSKGQFLVTLCKEGFDSAEASVGISGKAAQDFLVFEIGASESWPPTKL